MNYDLDSKVECEICVSKYLRFVHEAKCKLEQLTSKRNEHIEKPMVDEEKTSLDLDSERRSNKPTKFSETKIYSEIEQKDIETEKPTDFVNQKIPIDHNTANLPKEEIIEPKFPLNKLFENIMKRINTESSRINLNEHNELENSYHKINKSINDDVIQIEDEIAGVNISDSEYDLNIPKENEILNLKNKEIASNIPQPLINKDIKTNEYSKNNSDGKKISVNDDTKIETGKIAQQNEILENNEFMESEPKPGTFQFHKKFRFKDECEEGISVNSDEINKEVEDSIIDDSKKLFTEEATKNLDDNTNIIYNREKLDDTIFRDFNTSNMNDISKIEHFNSPFKLQDVREKGGYIQNNDNNNNNQNLNKQLKVDNCNKINNDINQEELNASKNKNVNLNIHSNFTNNFLTDSNDVSIIKPIPKEKPIKTISYLADETFLQKIEEKEQEKEKEVQQALDEIQQIESKLNLDERLMHEKWQIRKNAFKEISNLITTFVQYTANTDNKINNEEKLQMFETFSHWLKYFISDSNITALAEGLNTFYVFIINAAEYRNKAMIDFFDEMDKIVSYLKPNVNETSTKIINFCLSNKKMMNFTFNELIKKLNSNNNKILQFVCKIIFEFIINPINEPYIKLVLEKSLLQYSTLLTSKNIEKKKLFAKIIQDIYAIVEDDVDSIKKNVKPISINHKDLEKLLNGVKKKNMEKRIFIYNSYSSQQSIQSNNDCRTNVPKSENGERYESNIGAIKVDDMNSHFNTSTYNQNKSNTINTEYASNSTNFNMKDSAISNSSNQSPTAINDILSFIPSDFYDIPYTPNYNTKKEVLEKLNRSLANVCNIKDKEKDHKEVLSIINYTIEDSNIFVHLEGIKCLCHLSRLLQGNINQSKLKLVVSLCFDKFKDKKSLIRLELYNLFDCLIINGCFMLEYFLNFSLQYASTQKVAIVKQHILEYIKLILTEEEAFLQNKVKLREIIQSLEVNTYINISKHLVDIILTEPLSNIKDICTDILIKCKLQAELSESEENLERFVKMINMLPAYRSNIILSGKANYNKEEISEKEYKMNLRRIKSIIPKGNSNSSRSRSKEVKFLRGNTNINNNYATDNVRSNANTNSDNSINNIKINKSNYSKRNSESASNTHGKENIKIKLSSNKNLNKIASEVKLKYNSNLNSITKSKDTEIGTGLKSKDKKKYDSSNEIESSNNRIINKRMSQKLNSKVSVTKNEYSSEKYSDNLQGMSDSDNNIKVIIDSSKRDNENVEDYSAVNSERTLTETSRVYSTNKSVLEKRMESAIDHIYSLKKDELFDYTKKVIRDFLIFVQNVNNKKLNEDLESHFEVIFKILSKIFERISKIFKNFIPDELIIQCIKVVVVASCFLNQDENEASKANRETIRKFLERIRHIIKDEEKLCSFYIDVVTKFINFDKNSSSFLENINPKWVFINFIEYIRSNIQINELKCYENFMELVFLVQNSALLTEKERGKFLIIKDFDNQDPPLANPTIQESRVCDELESSLIKNIKKDINREEMDEENQNDLGEGQQFDEKSEGIRYSEKFKDSNQEEIEECLAGNIKDENETNLDHIRKRKKSNSFDFDKSNRSDLYHDESSYKKKVYEIMPKIENRNTADVHDSEYKHEVDLNISDFNTKSKIDKQSTITTFTKQIEEQAKEMIKFSNDNINLNDTDSNNLNIQNNYQKIEGNTSGRFLNIPEDVVDIKDKIKEKMRKLDLTIQRIGNKIDNQGRNNQNKMSNMPNPLANDEFSSDSNLKYDNHIPDNQINRNKTVKNNSKPIRSLEDFYDEEKKSMDIGQSNTNSPINHALGEYSKLNTVQNTSVLSNISSNPILHHDISKVSGEQDYKNLIIKIPSNLLDNNVSEIILYVKLESIFSKISNECKLNFSQELSEVLENSNLIKASSFNCFLQLFEFLLTLLTNEMKLSYRYIHADSVKDQNKQQHQEIILKLQQIVENLLRVKDLSEILKILIFLLKKFLPADFSSRLDKDCLLYLKTISYLMKTAIEIKKSHAIKIRTYEILQEINDLFISFPPTNLKEGIPNLNDLDKIYKLLKILTDLSVQSSYEEARLFLSNFRKGVYKSQYCEIYLNYLDNIINNN